MIASRLARRARLLLLLAPLGLLAGCGMSQDYAWGWYIFSPLTEKGQSNLAFMAAGLVLTLQLSISAILLSVLLGVLLAVGGLSSWRPARWQTFRHVVFPQAIRTILPALGNQFVYVMKMSSLVSVVGLQELTRRANELNVTEYRPLEIYSLLVLEYLLLILLTSWLVRRLERRLARTPG
jgi:ABC-type amino acid transport system permease subunit